MYRSLQTIIFEHMRDDDGEEIYANNPDWSGPVTPLVGTRDAVTDAANPIWSGILQGGLYDRPIDRTSTPDAFYQTKYGGNMRTAGWVRPPARNKHRQADAIPAAYEGICRVYLFSSRSRDGRDRLERACLRIRELISGWSFQSAEGPMVFPEFEDFAEPYDSEEFVGEIATYCRIRLHGRYANEV